MIAWDPPTMAKYGRKVTCQKVQWVHVGKKIKSKTKNTNKNRKCPHVSREMCLLSPSSILPFA